MISVEVDIIELYNLRDILSCLTNDTAMQPFQLKIDINFSKEDIVNVEEQLRIYDLLANTVDLIHTSADVMSVVITPTSQTVQLCSEIVKLVATEQLRPTIIFKPATTDIISDFMKKCVQCPMSIKADLTELKSITRTIPCISLIDSAVKEYHTQLRTDYHEVELIIRKPTTFGTFDGIGPLATDKIVARYGTDFPFKVTIVDEN